MELAAALSESSPQLQWLRYAGPAGQTIWAEVQQQADLVGRRQHQKLGSHVYEGFVGSDLVG